jgi:hypothetical protein
MRTIGRFLTLAGLVTFALAFSPFSQAPASAAVTIQPGVSIVNETGGQCTTNWVYDGTGSHAGEVFIGTAAHCVDAVGEAITMQTGTFGTASQVIGEVALMGSEEGLDYALIRVDPANEGQVSPAMKGHPQIPTGVSTSETAVAGDIVQFSGNGVGFHATAVTQESRVGVLHFNDGVSWSAIGPISPGDSGGPVADTTDGNKALGVVDVLCVGTQCLGGGGVTLEAVLADAAARGFPVTLRTV